jgi:hypothetical protein
MAEIDSILTDYNEDDDRSGELNDNVSDKEPPTGTKTVTMNSDSAGTGSGLTDERIRPTRRD